MKLVSVAAPALAVAMVPLIADDAVAYALENPSTESVQAELLNAICAQDWDKASDLSGNLIASPEITPEHRQILVDWRYRFSSYSNKQIKFDSVPNCKGATEIEVQPYQATQPRFSKTTPVASSPCYMDMGGVRTDLSYMCGTGEPTSVVASLSSTVVVPVVATSSTSGPNIWTRNLFFYNSNSSAITGNIHNSGSIAAENVMIEATGYAEGRTPQVRRTSIDRLAANDARPVTIDFGFSVPVDSWDVRVVSWD
ncbi:MAG: hypothetical protein F6K11_27655 [Leptolyngbya sp. SIO3F4]|nr:hypothetical protein [Leptolyngbya sp. SIO3F4]